MTTTQTLLYLFHKDTQTHTQTHRHKHTRSKHGKILPVNSMQVITNGGSNNLFSFYLPFFFFFLFIYLNKKRKGKKKQHCTGDKAQRLMSNAQRPVTD